VTSAVAPRGAAGRAEHRARSAARPPVDLRDLLPDEVPRQGMRPLCLPFALTGGHEAARCDEDEPPTSLAPEPLWWWCVQNGHAHPGGTLLEHASAALVDSGQVELDMWPYNPQLGYGTEPPPEPCGSPPWQRAQWREVELAHDGVEDELEDVLFAGYPVLLVVELTEAFDEPDPDGSVHTPSLRAAPGDYHAVLVVGAATDPDHGRRLLVRNSWGEGWGAGGYCWLPLTYLIAFAPQAAIVFTEATSDDPDVTASAS
jgi:hypothetical protein